MKNYTECGINIHQFWQQCSPLRASAVTVKIEGLSAAAEKHTAATWVASLAVVLTAWPRAPVNTSGSVHRGEAIERLCPCCSLKNCQGSNVLEGKVAWSLSITLLEKNPLENIAHWLYFFSTMMLFIGSARILTKIYCSSCDYDAVFRHMTYRRMCCV